MNESQYEKMQETQAIGETMKIYMDAILEDWEVETLSGFVDEVYERVECGPSIGFQLHDGTNVWNGSQGIFNLRSGDIKGIWVSSIVEGSDAEVNRPLFDLERIAHNDEINERDVVQEFRNLVYDVNDEANLIWEEVTK